MTYQHILLVTDLTADADRLAKKTKHLHASQDHATLSVLHVVKDNLTGFGYEMITNSPAYDIMDIKRVREAHERLASFVSHHGLDNSNCEVNVAMSSADGIHRYVNEHDVDLLVIGRHQHHGLKALFKSNTVDELLPELDCDLLVVHLSNAASTS